MIQVQDFEIPPDIRRYFDCRMRCGDKTIGEFYIDRLLAGVAPRMAETLAMQQAPGIGLTAAQSCQDQNRWGRSILERMGNDADMVERLRRNLAKHGYRLKADDHYISTAAEFDGDPRAIVNENQSLKELERRVAERVERAKQEPARIKRRLAPSIVERIRGERIRENPDLAHADQRELTQDIIETHGTKAEVV